MKGDGQFHVSRWPPGWRADRRRVPSVLVNVDGDWQIVDPDGRSWPVTSHAEVLAIAAHPYPEEATKPRHLDVFVDRLPHYPFMKEAMDAQSNSDSPAIRDRTARGNHQRSVRDEPKCDTDQSESRASCVDHGAVLRTNADTRPTTSTNAYPRGKQHIGGLVCSYGRLKIRIEEAAAWGAECADGAFLARLTDLYALLGVGAYPTPGGLGMSVMEAEYLAAGYQRQSRPSVALRSALLDGRIGGRNDWVDSDETFERVWECDQRNAYCSAAARPLPVGGVVRFLDGEVKPGDDKYLTWYGLCTVVNSRGFANSPILERGPAGRLKPFTRVGCIDVWLWKEEVEEAVRNGQTVIVLDGWGWRKMAAVLTPWAKRMHQARATAAKVSPELEQMVKLTIVAAIGRHGCRPERRSVIPLDQASDGDTVLTDCLDGNWASHTESDVDAPWNTVWHSYIEMLIRLDNYQLQVAETERGNRVLNSNVDAVYFLNVPAVVHEPDILGGWRVRDKHNVRFPYARSLLSDEKVSLPGYERRSEGRRKFTNVLG